MVVRKRKTVRQDVEKLKERCSETYLGYRCCLHLGHDDSHLGSAENSKEDDTIRWSSIHVGDLYRVREEVWEKWCFQNVKDYLPFRAQPVISIRVRDKSYVMLAYPMYWWEEEDLEPVNEEDRDTQV